MFALFSKYNVNHLLFILGKKIFKIVEIFLAK